MKIYNNFLVIGLVFLVWSMVAIGDPKIDIHAEKQACLEKFEKLNFTQEEKNLVDQQFLSLLHFSDSSKMSKSIDCRARLLVSGVKDIDSNDEMKKIIADLYPYLTLLSQLCIQEGSSEKKCVDRLRGLKILHNLAALHLIEPEAVNGNK